MAQAYCSSHWTIWLLGRQSGMRTTSPSCQVEIEKAGGVQGVQGEQGGKAGHAPGWMVTSQMVGGAGSDNSTRGGGGMGASIDPMGPAPIPWCREIA